MKRSRGLQVLARLRRLELNGTRRSLQATAEAMSSAQAATLTHWDEVVAVAGIDRAEEIRWRGHQIEAARQSGIRMKQLRCKLETAKAVLEDKARADFLIADGSSW